jgi:hypothetical protein
MAVAKHIPTPYLEFKFLKNVSIELGTPQRFSIPTDMRAQPNPHAKRKPGEGPDYFSEKEPETYITLPFFDMNHVHKLELKNERPIIPTKLAGMSETYHSKLCDAAYERAAEAKIFNDGVRARVNSYVENGTLEIVNDPFASEDEVEGLAELAATLKDAEDTKNAPSTEAEKIKKSTPKE